MEPETPFRWSEDFGYFTQNYPGSFFGVGAGKNQPELHNPDYDFPDKIIPSAIKMFDGIIRRMLAG
jgi:metal-dependent amidase/aminoacylase/carboxypeptidase family protein